MVCWPGCGRGMCILVKMEDDGAVLPWLICCKLELPSHRKHKRYRTPQATISELLGGETKTQTQGPRKEKHGEDNGPLVGATGIKQRHAPPNPRKRKTHSGTRTPQHRKHKKARLHQSTFRHHTPHGTSRLLVTLTAIIGIQPPPDSLTSYPGRIHLVLYC